MNESSSPIALAPALSSVQAVSPEEFLSRANDPSLGRVLASWQTAALIFFYSALLGLGTFALNGRYTLNLADEGFLRYGVRAIVEVGQVPMRDFQAYDPARYYWVAAWTPLLGDGIVSTRLACALFQVLTVGVALLALRRAGASWYAIGSVGLLVTFWMVERFKLFEQCIALAALYPAVRLIQRPDRRNALLAGVFVGLAACMGRNHGFYNALAFGGLLVGLAWKFRRPDLLGLFFPWVCGVILGYLPMLLTMAFVPGFFAAFVESLSILAHAKTTNFTIPVPWPWTMDLDSNIPTGFFYYLVAQSWCFLLLAVGFVLVGSVLAWLPGQRWRENAWLVAAGAIGIPYAHYAYSRADGPHLAHSMPLLLVALLGLPALMRHRSDRTKVFAALASGLMLLSFTATMTSNPILIRWAMGGQKAADIKIGKETLLLNPPAAAFLRWMQRFARTNMAPDENILILPSDPMLYEVVGRFSPLHELYFLWPQSAGAEQKAIRELEKNRVNWTMLKVEVMDDMPERSLPATHPILMKYLQERFRPVAGSPLPAPYLLLQRKDPLPAP